MGSEAQNVGTRKVLSRQQVVVPIISATVFNQKGLHCSLGELGFRGGKVTYILPPRKVEEELNIEQGA